MPLPTLTSFEDGAVTRALAPGMDEVERAEGKGCGRGAGLDSSFAGSIHQKFGGPTGRSDDNKVLWKIGEIQWRGMGKQPNETVLSFLHNRRGRDRGEEAKQKVVLGGAKR